MFVFDSVGNTLSRNAPLSRDKQARFFSANNTIHCVSFTSVKHVSQKMPVTFPVQKMSKAIPVSPEKIASTRNQKILRIAIEAIGNT